MDRFARELLAELRKQPEFAVTLPFEIGDGPKGAAHPSGRAGRSTARFITYPTVARRLDADLFHIADQGYAHLAAALPAHRVIVSCFDIIPLRGAATAAPYRVPKVTELRCRLSFSFLRRVARVACASEATRQDVIRWARVDPRRATVIRLGVGDRFRPFSGQQRRALALPGCPPSARVLLHVGSGPAYKNVEGTLEVLARVRAVTGETVLLRVGAGLTREQRALAGRLGVSRSVVELGWIEDERLLELYNSVDALIFPSHWEGFGWPPLEALACGTPTVVSDCPALLETVGDAALSAPATDPDALARAVLRIWDEPELQATLRQRGLTRACDYSYARMARGYADLYRSLTVPR